MIEIQNLSFGYEAEDILKDVWMTFNKSGLYGILGPNGVGKTTLLKIIGGLLKPRKGKICFEGIDIKDIPKKELAKLIAYVPQQVNVGYAFKVKEILEMGRHPYHERFDSLKPEEHQLIRNAIKVTGLEAHVNHYINEISAGEMQRVMIARALVQDTKIIILDEPISHLDIHYQKEIIHLLKAVATEKDKIIITVLHDMNVGLNYCDFIHLLSKDRITSGLPKDVLTCERLEEVYGTKVYKIENTTGQYIHW